MDRRLVAGVVGGLTAGFVIGVALAKRSAAPKRVKADGKGAEVLLDVSSRTNHPVRTKFRDPVPDEVEGDVFDRQRVMVGWDQGKVEDQVALVLGTGGLGQSVAMGLVRMGIKQVYLLDREAYDASNLTRQILGGIDDVGLRKVEAAKRNLRVHNLRTKIVTMDMDAVIRWKDVVTAARHSTVIFNCIDFGGMFDYAVNSLCKELRIPYVSGSSYGYSTQTEFFTGQPEHKCWTCLNSFVETFRCTSSIARRAQFQEELKEFLEKHGISVDAKLSENSLCLYLTEALHMRQVQPIVKSALRELGKPSGVPFEEAPEFFNTVKDHVLAMLQPGSIGSLDTIEMIPREDHFPTRHVGSWVTVCVGAAMTMVNAWTQCMLDHSADQVPSTFELSWVNYSGSTDRTYGGLATSDDECGVCKTAKKLHNWVSSDGEGGAEGAGAGAGAGAGSQ